ncbi:TetR/AcrR family transcriptional regulator [Paenibacillus mesophilus]|uniref:TetR/AcrR family transcriptional regulator n=1 Tax=Paenibacillus mesophilus TaxID=2582849 RepID=UPI001EE45E31|nr:TetR/AcrR family transcriptional regulator [Paenibacillus mesophilus]
MENSPEDTRDKILNATASLMQKRGFKAVTTKAIAREAKVNETTLFRHFGSKKGIVEALVDQYSYLSTFEGVLNHVVWDLEKDLFTLSKAYQNFMLKNGDIVMIGLKEAGVIPELDEKAASIPRDFKQGLMRYFQLMREKELLRETELEAQAMSFIWLNLGFFVSRSVYGDRITKLDTDAFLLHSVSTFARGLKP